MMDKVPSMALGSPPLTGASIIFTPLAAQAFSISCEASGAMELMSIRMVPALAPSSTPPGPITASFTCGELGSMVITMGHCSATALHEAAALAPAATTLATFSATMS